MKQFFIAALRVSLGFFLGCVLFAVIAVFVFQAQGLLVGDVGEFVPRDPALLFPAIALVASFAFWMAFHFFLHPHDHHVARGYFFAGVPVALFCLLGVYATYLDYTHWPTQGLAQELGIVDATTSRPIPSGQLESL